MDVLVTSLEGRLRRMRRQWRPRCVLLTTMLHHNVNTETQRRPRITQYLPQAGTHVRMYHLSYH
jgi:hypothetical protein